MFGVWGADSVIPGDAIAGFLSPRPLGEGWVRVLKSIELLSAALTPNPSPKGRGG